MKQLSRQIAFAFLLSFIFFLSNAEVKTPKIFSSNMVLQQGIEIPVWGWADKGERITIQLNSTEIRTKADKDGRWNIKLPAQEYGGPHRLTISGKNTLTFDNILIGEVWVCSGQSNMEWRVDMSNNPEEEIAAANYPNIRLFTVPKEVAQFPQEDISSGKWKECSPESIPGFSAVAYFFGRKLEKDLNVPIGLIHTSWGGTVAETWTSPQTIQTDPDFKPAMMELQKIDVEKLREQKLQKLKELLGGEIPQTDGGMKGGEPVWANPATDVSDWKSISISTYWEQQGYVDIDGIAWYRTDIILSAEEAKTDAELHLGKIDDSDWTFINGVSIGVNENQYSKDRIYKIPKELLKEGANTIVVRVEDTGGNGGIYGSEQNQYFLSGETRKNLSGKWKFKISKATVQATSIGPNSYPTLLFNAMINPIIPFGIKGAIWYQGESNADRALQYQRVFPNLINDWRRHWNQGDFPFLFVSLANYTPAIDEPGESNWAELREAQTKTLALPNTGMALTIDIGEADDIHPRNKQDVGIRLALNALKIAYDKNIVHSGPMYSSVDFKTGEAILTFNEVGSGLVSKDKYGYLKGFAIAGSDKKFYWAKAEIVDNNKVVVYSKDVRNPVSVRYGWANNPDDLNLYNKEGLPANPFRTDNWKGITK